MCYNLCITLFEEFFFLMIILISILKLQTIIFKYYNFIECFQFFCMQLFKDGITNHLVKCYLKDDPDNAVLIRVYGEKTELFIDRDLEVRNMQMLYDAGLSEPLYCAFSNGLCYGYFPGEVLDTKMVRDPIISR